MRPFRGSTEHGGSALLLALMVVAFVGLSVGYNATLTGNRIQQSARATRQSNLALFNYNALKIMESLLTPAPNGWCWSDPEHCPFLYPDPYLTETPVIRQIRPSSNGRWSFDEAAATLTVTMPYMQTATSSFDEVFTQGNLINVEMIEARVHIDEIHRAPDDPEFIDYVDVTSVTAAPNSDQTESVRARIKVPVPHQPACTVFLDNQNFVTGDTVHLHMLAYGIADRAGVEITSEPSLAAEELPIQGADRMKVGDVLAWPGSGTFAVTITSRPLVVSAWVRSPVDSIGKRFCSVSFPGYQEPVAAEGDTTDTSTDPPVFGPGWDTDTTTATETNVVVEPLGCNLTVNPTTVDPEDCATFAMTLSGSPDSAAIGGQTVPVASPQLVKCNHPEVGSFTMTGSVRRSINGTEETAECSVDYSVSLPVSCTVSSIGRDGQGYEYTLEPLNTWDTSSGCGWQLAYATGPNVGTVLLRNDANGCFDASTKIMMADGSKRRADRIRQGDQVWNPLTRRAAEVAEVIRGPERRPMVEIDVGGMTIRVTDGHPMITARGILKAGDLEPTDWLEIASGAVVPITRLRLVDARYPQTVWNFSLRGNDAATAHAVVANGIVTGDLVLQRRIAHPSEGASPNLAREANAPKGEGR